MAIYDRAVQRSGLALVLLVSFAWPCYAQQGTSKQVCLSSFGMNWANSEDAQRHLVISVKREAVGELFGEMIWSMTEVKDLVVTRDEIRAFSAGLVRMRGTPRFFNGSSLGEVCVAADLYMSSEDVSRFRPRAVSKKVCVADPRLSSGELRTTAERQAQIQAVQDFEPGLQGASDEFLLRLLHEAVIENAGFVSETLTYCATARGVVYPVELLAALQNYPTQRPEAKAKSVFSTPSVWSGTLRQERSQEYSAVLRLGALEKASSGQEIGTAEYPALSCSSKLYFVRAQKEGPYTLREVVVNGRLRCISGSEILIEPIDASSSRFSWSGSGESASGVLSRTAE